MISVFISPQHNKNLRCYFLESNQDYVESGGQQQRQQQRQQQGHKVQMAILWRREYLLW